MASKRLVLGIAIAIFAATATIAQEPVKIGFITTLSGPGGYLGQDLRDAFQLAVNAQNGTLGDVPVRLIVQDDGLKPGTGKQIAANLMGGENVKLFTGVAFSNVAGAIVPDIVDAGNIFISPNAGPSNFAGKDCNKNYFVMSWLTDTMQGSAGQNATRLNYKRAYVLAPNYQAGKDAIEGFKRLFKGEIIGETYTRLDQTDFASEMAQIRAANPDVVFQFHPGGLGISFMRQYQQAGLLGSIPMVVAEASMDATLLQAVGDAATGIDVSGAWNSDFDNPVSRRFVDGFTKAYGRLPTMYAAQGYDTAIAIGSALKAVGGNVADTEGFRAAMLKADFKLTRESFKFGRNQHPVQDWYSMKVDRGADGKPVLKTQGKILNDYGDPFAAACKL
jgi:branched-chain amino acid transport system substrate-binding protein